jgi:2-methylisocitrate lyase-like PEP mutase family enzyme
LFFLNKNERINERSKDDTIRQKTFIEQSEPENLGLNAVVFRLTAVRLAMGEAGCYLDAILADCDQNRILERMQHRKISMNCSGDCNRFDQNPSNLEVQDKPMA